ncbi:MAG: glycerate kinase type-2 family protein [Candidatus Kryptoniota bacterium]
MKAELIINRIVERAINAVRPSNLFETGLTVHGTMLNVFGYSTHIGNGRNVRCVAIGKCAEAMAYEVRRKLGSQVSGVIASPINQRRDIPGFEFYETGHPFPDERSEIAGRRIIDFLSKAGEKDLYIFLISGGGTASIFIPVEGVSLENIRELNRILMAEGVPISKINLVRRHLSQLAGGKMAELVKSREKVSLIISDVVGDDLLSIASGPTIPDTTSPKDAIQFLSESGIAKRVSPNIINALRHESPANPRLLSNYVKIIASNRDALSEASFAAREGGFNSEIFSNGIEGDVSVVAEMLIETAMSIKTSSRSLRPPAVGLFGGETTVRVKGNGMGGRNQELVLHALYMIKEKNADEIFDSVSVFSFGTDGKDGNSDAAGAWFNAGLPDIKRIAAHDIKEYLENNDSSSFFRKYGHLIETGPTDTNVMDIFGVVVE